MPTYASQTSVSSEKSRAEIESTLARYGASHFGYMSAPDSAQIAFRHGSLTIRFVLALPDRTADEFRLTPSRKWERSADEQVKAYEQAVRQRWRALALVVKAKLEAVEAGIATFEQEFYAHVVLPNGRTVYEETGAAVAKMIETGDSGPLMIES